MTREALLRLAHKYARLGELREARARGEPIPERAVFRELASEFPGALRELDTLPLDEIAARHAALAAAAEGGTVEPWMEWLDGYHRTFRAALYVKPRVGRGAVSDLAARASERTGALVDEAFVRAVAEPPGGRLEPIVLGMLAARHGRPAEEIRRTLFPHSRRRG